MTEASRRRRRAPRFPESRGFTLLEILLAVSLSALLLTVVYVTYFSIERSIDGATENQDTLETGRMLSELIKKDIRGISPGRFPLIGKNEVIEEFSIGQLEFVTTASLDGDPSKLRRVGYELVMDDRGQKILVRKESTNLIDRLDATARVFEVSKIIEAFKLEFYDGTVWAESWDSTSTGVLPKQIRVTIDVTGAKGGSRRFTAEETIQSAV